MTIATDQKWAEKYGPSLDDMAQVIRGKAEPTRLLFVELGRMVGDLLTQFELMREELETLKAKQTRNERKRKH